MCRLLAVEHVYERDKPVLYLVFEYVDTDLKKFMEKCGAGKGHPLDPATVKVMTLRTTGHTRMACSFQSLIVMLMIPVIFAELYVSAMSRSCALPQPWCPAQVR